MKVSFPFPLLQFFSAIFIASTSLKISHNASAQAPAPAAAGADYVILKAASANAQPLPLANVLIVAVRGGKVVVKNAQGEIGYDLALIQEVRKAAPPKVAEGRAALEQGDLDGALRIFKGVADLYKGLPTPWATEATAILGNLYVNLGKLPEAEAAFNDFQKAYPASSSAVVSVGKARIAAERGKFAEAKDVAAPIVKDALTKKNVSREENQLFGQAYYVLGRVAEGEGKLPEAMENYCRTVAIFYQERAVVSEAEKRIDALRKKGITTP